MADKEEYRPSWTSLNDEQWAEVEAKISEERASEKIPIPGDIVWVVNRRNRSLCDGLGIVMNLKPNEPGTVWLKLECSPGLLFSLDSIIIGEQRDQWITEGVPLPTSES